MNHFSSILGLICLGLMQHVVAFGTTGLMTKPMIQSQHTQLSMKIFDWKKRKAFEALEVPDDYKLSVSTIFPIPGSRQKPRRIGRGVSAGQGGTCGKGMRGQNSRAGSGTRPGFEGGQTPLYRRLPKYPGRTMRGHTKTVYELIPLNVLGEVEENSTVDFASLFEKQLVTKENKGRKIYKVIGTRSDVEYSIKKNLTVRAHAFTSSAREEIESNGGKCVVLSPTRNIPIEEALADKALIKAENLVKLKALRALKKKRDEAKADARV